VVIPKIKQKQKLEDEAIGDGISLHATEYLIALTSDLEPSDLDLGLPRPLAVFKGSASQQR